MAAASATKRCGRIIGDSGGCGRGPSYRRGALRQIAYVGPAKEATMRLSQLKKLAAVLLLAGMVLPYGCDARPITVLWTWSHALASVGVLAVYYGTAFLPEGGLQYGGWVFTVGYVAAVVVEVLGLRRTAPVTHGG